MNDCDNCQHNFANNDERCGLCRAVGVGEYPGWEEEEETQTVPVVVTGEANRLANHFRIAEYRENDQGITRDWVSLVVKAEGIVSHVRAFEISHWLMERVPVEVVEFSELERLRAEVQKLEKVREILTEHMRGTGTDAIENVCALRNIWKAVKP